MKDITIYCAGPIDLGTDVPNWRNSLKEKIEDTSALSAVLFDPSTAFKVTVTGFPGPAVCRYIEDVNRMVLELADVMVVCLPSKVPTVGTPIEIDLADRSNKPIYIITDIPFGKSVYLNNRIGLEQWFYCDLGNPADFDNALLKLVNALKL